MKKILVLLVVSVIGGPLFAQSPSNMDDIKEALSVLIEKTEQYKAEKENAPVIKMGKNEFQLERALKEEPDGKEMWTYYYVPVNQPLTYKLDTKFESADNDAMYKVLGRANSLLIVGPQMWRVVDFEVSGVEIVIYADNRFEQIKQDWERRFTKECVYSSEKPQDNALKVAGLWQTPAKAYLLADGRTAVVYVEASAAKYGPYKRACSKWHLDALFKDQPQFQKVNADGFIKEEKGIPHQ